MSNELFLEQLDLQHRPDATETVRVRVQARQVYVFAEAARMGWDRERAADLVALGVSALTDQARRADGLFGKTLKTDGTGLANDDADLYDTAFALYAFAHAAPWLDDPERARKAVVQTEDAIAAHLTDPAGGYAERLPRPDRRLQNPHMHLFEARMALAEAFPGEGHDVRAQDLKALAMARFFQGDRAALFEDFNPDWTLADDRIEPGHQFEWVWLLHHAAALFGEPVLEEAAALYSTGLRLLDDDGRACMAVGPDGDVRDGSFRTWSQTEALKAHLARAESGAQERAAQAFDLLMDEFLTPDGGWIDHYGADGGVLATAMPASTGYHVVLAFSELIRLHAD